MKNRAVRDLDGLRWRIFCYFTAQMRGFVSLAVLLGFTLVAQAVERPITVKEISLMLRGGFSSATIIRELSTRSFAETLNAEQESQLIKGGATPELLNALKGGAKTLRPAQTAKPASPSSTTQRTINPEEDRKFDTLAQTAAAPTAQNNPGSGAAVVPVYVNEQQWVADQIVRDIAEILSFAKTGPNSDSAQLNLTTDGGSGSTPTIRVLLDSPNGPAKMVSELKHHLWSAENYSPWVTALIDSWSVPKPANAQPVDGSLIDGLTQRDLAVLIRQSKRISEALNRQPLDAELNEEAALILGCFALREASGMFYDVRPTLSRLTTHLAIARAIRPAEGDAGKLARLIQLVLIGRQKEALDGVATLPANQARWANIIKLRATGDWRILKAPVKASSLEQIEEFRALRRAGASYKSFLFLRDIHASTSPDWMRVAMETPLSVQEGHLFAEQGLSIEMVSLGADWNAFSGNSMRQSEITDLLNRPASRCASRTIDARTQLEVLSWGDIAAFHQRHLCHSIVVCNQFLRDKLGTPEEARQFERTVSQVFSGLTLFPIVKVKMAPKGEAAGVILPDANKVWREHPEVFTEAIRASMPQSFVGNGPQVTAFSWFHPPIPFGTAYDLAERADGLWNPELSSKPPPFLAELKNVAPYDFAAIRLVARSKYGPAPTAEQVAENNASIHDFDIHAMWDIADRAKDQPAVYGKVLAQICELEPDYFVNLGNYYVDKLMPTEAAAAFQNAFDRAADRVYVSNNCSWLVNYYFDKGRKDDAMKIAKDAAEAYSSRGLETMAILLEKWAASWKRRTITKRSKRATSTAANWIRSMPAIATATPLTNTSRPCERARFFQRVSRKWR